MTRSQDPAKQGVRQVGASGGQKVVMARWIGDVPKDIYHSDQSSEDSLEPVGESGVETPFRNGEVEYYEELLPLFACGPARLSSRLNHAFCS